MSDTDHNQMFSFKNPKDNLGFSLWQATMAWQKNINRKLASVEITYVQFLVMAVIHLAGQMAENVTQQDIAKHAKIDKMMVSSTLKILSKKLIIVRSENKTDTRSKNVQLTKNGVEILTKAVKIFEQTDSLVFTNIPDKNLLLKFLHNISEQN